MFSVTVSSRESYKLCYSLHQKVKLRDLTATSYKIMTSILLIVAFLFLSIFCLNIFGILSNLS
jgi:hypothetical protein